MHVKHHAIKIVSFVLAFNLLLSTPVLLPAAAAPASPHASTEKIDINGPSGSEKFGEILVPLTNGNLVVADTGYDDGATADVGAVYLYNGATGALISTLKGSHANDQIGSKGVIGLSNGNYIVGSPKWDNATITDAGAVTWCSGVTGCDGVVSAANSLVGGSASDQISNEGLVALPNGNYVAASYRWNGASNESGAVSFCDGDTGCTGAVSAANSLIGTKYDRVGSDGVDVLSNGNYIAYSPFWQNDVNFVGAITWCSGETAARAP